MKDYNLTLRNLLASNTLSWSWNWNTGNVVYTPKDRDKVNNPDVCEYTKPIICIYSGNCIISELGPRLCNLPSTSPKVTCTPDGTLLLTFL